MSYPLSMKLFDVLKADSEESKSLIYAMALTLLVLIVEAAGGFLSNSLALLSDAAHVLADLVSLGLALLAIMLSALPSSDTRTYGWHRSEVFAALINGLTLIGISGLIVYEAVHRLTAPEPVHSVGMLVAAAFGLLVNLFVVKRLHAHDHHDLNMRSAFLHVLGDVLISAGVIAGAIAIYFTGWTLVDPILSIIFSLVILRGAGVVLYDSAHILLEGVPKGMSVQRVVDEIKSRPYVVDVHRVHVWSICSNITALSAHVLIEPTYEGDRKVILDDISCRLSSCFNINHATLQLEKGECEYTSMVCDVTHCERRTVSHAHAGHDHAGHRH